MSGSGDNGDDKTYCLNRLYFAFFAIGDFLKERIFLEILKNVN